MARILSLITILGLFVMAFPSQAQETGQEASSSASEPAFVDISGPWITQSGNLVELTLDGTEVTLYWPEFARYMTATFVGDTLVYTTHYNDPSHEECYLDAPDSERAACVGFIQRGDPRHRFTLTLSEDGTVLSGVKEINLVHCVWDTDENGHTYNHRPAGTEWVYSSDYQWRRSNCDFSNLPSLSGNVIDKYDLIEIIFDRFGVREEFSLDEFDVRERVRFEYAQCYLDANTGIFVSSSEATSDRQLEPLDGRVYLDPASGLYMIELYPYAFQAYPTLLSGLTMLCHQLHALEISDLGLSLPTTQMEIDSVGYLWSHRQTLCTSEDELFNHHIDFLSRALQYRAMAED